MPNRNPDFKGNVILGVDGFKKTGRYFDPNACVVFNTSDLTKYSGSAGAITETAKRERQIQFALRLEF